MPVNQALAYGSEIEYRVIHVKGLPYLVAEDLYQDLLVKFGEWPTIDQILNRDGSGQSTVADVISADGEPIRIKGSQLAGAVARHPVHHLGRFFAKPRPFLAGDFVTTDAGTEIGRASCRARVCQYA